MKSRVTDRMTLIVHAHSAYDNATLMWISVRKRRARPVNFFPHYKNFIYILVFQKCDEGAYNNLALNFEGFALIIINSRK